VKRLWPNDWEGRLIVLIMLGAVVLFAVLVWMLVLIPRARGADLPMHVRVMDAVNAGRWKQMCKGAARYDAMREAYELKRPDPCNGGKKWVR
jgi:hypothetical protein